MDELTVPIACTLSAVDLSAQAERWRRLIARAAIARHETPAGIRIEFRAGAGLAVELEQLVAVETECCAWARWSVAAAADTVVLEVTSAGAGIAALRQMLTGGWPAPSTPPRARAARKGQPSPSGRPSRRTPPGCETRLP